MRLPFRIRRWSDLSPVTQGFLICYAIALVCLVWAAVGHCRTFTFSAPRWKPLNRDMCVNSPGDSLRGKAEVVDLRAWVTNLTPGRPGYGVRQLFFTDTKWVWAPWRPYLDGKAYTIRPPAKYCAPGDSCKLELKTKGRNGQWSCWTTYYWRER